MKLRLTPLQAAAAVVVIVGVSVPLMAWFEFRSNRGNLDRMLYSKGGALMETLLHGAENALVADRELSVSLAMRLADNARSVLTTNQTMPPPDSLLVKIVELNDLVRMDIFAPDGSTAASSDRSHAPGQVPRQFDRIEHPWVAVASYLELPGPDGIEDVPGELFAAGVRSPEGWTAVAAADGGELLAIQRSLGIGLILDDLSAVKGVSYAVLQDTLGIIAASSSVRELGSIRGDPFFPIPPDEIRGRYKQHLGEEIYELAAAFQWEGESYGYLRVGLSTEEVRSIAALNRRQIVLGMGMLAALLAVVGVLYFAGRSRLRLEQEHARIKSLSDSVLQGMEEAVIVLDEKERVILYNEACRNICGCGSPVPEGSTLERLNPVLARAFERLSGGWTNMAEIEMPRSGGAGPLPLLVSLSPLTVDRKLYTTIIISDLTDRRKAEEMALLSEKYKTMAEISAGVAHEIRNPLNAIAMNVQRLRLEFTPSGQDRDEYEEFIGIVLNEVERMNRIVEQFMRLARFPEPRFERGSLSRMIEESLGFLSPEIEGAGVVLHKSLESSPESFFDPGQLGQVISNLVRNALQSMERGGELTVRGKSDHGRYVVTISDTGAGIPENEMSRVFEPFFSTRRQGLGLGLAIVQRIVNEHGGSIRVESNPGKGASFIFSLPIRLT